MAAAARLFPTDSGTSPRRALNPQGWHLVGARSRRLGCQHGLFLHIAAVHAQIFSAPSALVAASADLPSNVEHTGQPAGARLTEAEPEEAVLSLAGFARSAKL